MDDEEKKRTVKLSTFIRRLQKIYDKYGDMPVVNSWHDDSVETSPVTTDLRLYNHACEETNWKRTFNKRLVIS